MNQALLPRSFSDISLSAFVVSSLGANLGARALIADRRQRHSANSRRDLGVPATPSREGERRG